MKKVELLLINNNWRLLQWVGKVPQQCFVGEASVLHKNLTDYACQWNHVFASDKYPVCSYLHRGLWEDDNNNHAKATHPVYLAGWLCRCWNLISLLYISRSPPHCVSQNDLMSPLSQIDVSPEFPTLCDSRAKTRFLSKCSLAEKQMHSCSDESPIWSSF